MPDKTHCEAAGGKFSVPKTVVEQEAQEAYALRLSPNDACPYPFYSSCGLHWLAHYNLCMPLPGARR